MSIEMHVLFRGKLPSKAALMRALRELGFPFTLKPATGSLERQNGYMPMLLRRDETGVEFDVFDDPAALAEFADLGIDPSLSRVANFRWAGDTQEMVAGLCCAAALARLVNGVVFDSEEGTLRSVDEAIAFARRHLEAIDKPQDARRPGTRPADIKRYLKPLLKLRPDLALVGRRLIIRPVRHLLRGALLDRTSDRYGFRLWWFVKPLYYGVYGIGHGERCLYGKAEGIGHGARIHDRAWKVYEPDFEPLLIDCLAADAFDHVGAITSLSDLARDVENDVDKASWLLDALILSGEREKLDATLDKLEHSDSYAAPYLRGLAKRTRAIVAEGTAALFSRFHSMESEAAREMGLAHIWEATPFPAELSDTDRLERASEPYFATTPWISRPERLYQDLPARPGEIRFARDWLYRKSEVKLRTPLSSVEAQELRRTYQPHVLAARLETGQLLCLCYDAGRNCRNPDQPKGAAERLPVAASFHLWVFGLSGVIFARFRTIDSSLGMLKLSGLELRQKDTLADIWTWHSDEEKGLATIWDDRGPERLRTERRLTKEDISLSTFPTPRFQDFQDLWRRTLALLESEGIDASA